MNIALKCSCIIAARACSLEVRFFGIPVACRLRGRKWTGQIVSAVASACAIFTLCSLWRKPAAWPRRRPSWRSRTRLSPRQFPSWSRRWASACSTAVPGKFEPTPYGRALLDSAVNVFDEMRLGIKRIEFLADPTSGELAVGCPEIILAGVLPAITEHFLQQHPRVQLRVIHADTALMQFDQLRKHNVELLIGRMPRPFIEDDLVSEPLFDEPFAVVAGINSQWARRRRVELTELAEEAWVLPPPDSVPGVLIARIFREHGFKQPRAGVLTLSVQLTTTLIATGRFCRTPAEFGGAVQCQTRRAQDIAGQGADRIGFGCCHHHQAPHPQSARQAVHQLSAHRRKIDLGPGDAKVNCRNRAIE